MANPHAKSVDHLSFLVGRKAIVWENENKVGEGTIQGWFRDPIRPWLVMAKLETEQLGQVNMPARNLQILSH